MFFYWFLMIFCTSIFFVGKMSVRLSTNDIYGRESNKEIKLCFVFVSFIMIFLISMRHESIGNDTYIYKYYFYERLADMDYSYLLSDVVKEKGYSFLQIFFNRIGLSFEAFNVLYAIFNVCVVMRLIYKWSDIPWVSVFLFFVLGFFVLNLTMMRQITAMSIVILAVMNEKDDNFLGFLKFLVAVLIAYSIHNSAVIALPMWFIKKARFNLKTVLFFFLLIILAYVFKAQLTGIVAEFASGMSDRYDRYNVEESGDFGNLFYIMMIVTLVASVFMSNFLSDRKNQILFMLTAIMLVIFPTTQVGGAAMRLYFYYYIFSIIYIPNMLSGMKRKRDFWMYLITLALFLAVGISEYNNSISSNQYHMVPYKFFWN